MLSAYSFAQFNTQFDKQEALELVSICNYWVNGKVKGVDSTHIDSKYKLLYESKYYKMDNTWQLWQKNDNAVVINLRGTTRKSISWLENFYAVMIPAEGVILLPDSQEFNYKFADDKRAAIHAGWAMGVGFLISDVLEKIKEANSKGIYSIYITGFSQGGALVHLLRAALEYMPEEQFSSKNNIKVYAFASPKPGNRFFAYDYASYTSIKNPSYTIINKADWVPQTPFTVQSPDNMSKVNPFIALENNEFNIPFFKRMYIKRKYYSIKNPINKSQKRLKKSLGYSVKKQIVKKVGKYNTPEYIKSSAYFPVGIQVILKGWEGDVTDEKLRVFWQHLPAHYYFLIDKCL